MNPIVILLKGEFALLYERASLEAQLRGSAVLSAKMGVRPYKPLDVGNASTSIRQIFNGRK